MTENDVILKLLYGIKEKVTKISGDLLEMKTVQLNEINVRLMKISNQNIKKKDY
jgi:hypothetical protein